MRADHEEEFRAFVVEASPALRRTALAASRDPHRADDLVQETLTKLYVAWPRVRREVGSPLAYARTTLVRSLVDEQRRPFWRREVRVERVPETGRADDTQRVVDHDWLGRALGGLSTRQRVAVVLRHLEGLSVAECAELIGTSETNVKAATREGMAALRAAARQDEGVSAP